MNQCVFRRLALGTSAVALVIPIQVAAQAGIEEVVVTAQKREQSLQDVSLSVTAVTAQSLQANGINNISRLDVMVPGLKVGQSGTDVRPNMRGARTEQVEHNDPAISFYSDGVYLPRHGQALAGFIDVERVEVLRGPQGTLFGRNSLGGAINIVTKKPSMEGFEYGGSFTAGDFERLRGEGFVNVPLGDRAAVRVSGVRETRDPYVENTFLGDEGGLKDADHWYVRGQALFEPTDDWSVMIRASRWEDDSNGFGSFGYFVEGIPVNPDTGLTNGVDEDAAILRERIGRSDECVNACGRQGAGFDFVASPGLDTAQPTKSDPYEIAVNTAPSLDIEMTTLSGEINWYGLPFADVKFIGSYVDYDETRFDDGDLSTFNSIVQGNFISSEATSQELQFTSKHDGPIDWVAGLYFHQEDLFDSFLWRTNFGVFSADLVDNAPPPNTPPNPLWAPWQNGIDIETRSHAVYGFGTLHANDSLRVIGGIRYTYDVRTWDILSQNPDDLSVRDISVPDPGLQDIEKSWNKVTWKAGVEWDVTPEVMSYFNASTGFLAGNAQGQFNGADTYDEQTVTAYEVGMKGFFLEGTLRLNVALYYNEFRDLLSQEFVDQGGTTLAFNVNGGAIDAIGAEIEADWQPTEALNLGLRVSLTDADYGDFVQANRFEEGGNIQNGAAFQLEGLQVQQTPDATATLLAGYDFQLGDLGLLRPSVTFFWSDNFRTSDDPLFFGEQDSYTRTDFSLSWISVNRKWRVRAYVNNVEDDAIIQRATRFGGNVAVTDFLPPRTFGATLSFNY